MGFLGFLKSKPPKDAVQRSVVQHADGSSTVTTSFEVKGTRPVRSEVVEALDAALAGLGGAVMHAMDPSRLLPYELGGPPIWSVGIVETPKYTLLVTYGFSHALSPEPLREGLNHEFSFAVPKGTPITPWADALLRHQCRYILENGADIRVNDCVPFRGVPMTRLPFQPEHHAAMPDSTLVGLLCTPDPVLPKVGDIEIRRLVCIDQFELDCAETWSPKGFLEELRREDPLLLSPLIRGGHMENPAFAARCAARAAADGGDVDAAMFDAWWEVQGADVVVHLPKAPRAWRLQNGIQNRAGFGRRLVAFCPRSPPIAFLPELTGVRATPRALELGADLAGPAGALLSALRTGDARVVFAGAAR